MDKLQLKLDGKLESLEKYTRMTAYRTSNNPTSPATNTIRNGTPFSQVKSSTGPPLTLTQQTIPT